MQSPLLFVVDVPTGYEWLQASVSARCLVDEADWALERVDSGIAGLASISTLVVAVAVVVAADDLGAPLLVSLGNTKAGKRCRLTKALHWRMFLEQVVPPDWSPLPPFARPPAESAVLELAGEQQ
jgi:hypothetical protein